MPYPIVTEAKAREFVALLLEEQSPSVDSFVDESNEGNVDLTAIATASAVHEDAWNARLAGATPAAKDRQRLEARMAGPIHSVLKDGDPIVLSDEGLWRFLALGPFLWYLQAREPELQAQDYGGGWRLDNKAKRVRTPFRSQLILRTYLWGKIAYDPTDEVDPYRLATIVGDQGGSEIDIWHSHLIRIQLGHLGEMPRAFLESITTKPTATDTDDARFVEKRLTRLKHSLLFDVYDRGEALVLADGVKSSLAPPGKSS